MRIISLREYPDFAPDIEFKESVRFRLIAAIAMQIVCIFLWFATHYPIHGVLLPRLWCYLAAAIAEMIAFFCWTSYRKSRLPTNWLLRASGNRQWIKFRSFLNNHHPEDNPQIIELDRDDVAWVRSVTSKVVYLTHGSEGGTASTRQTIRYLDIALNGIDTTELEQALRNEYSGESGPGFRVRFLSYPVSVPEPGTIRLIWSHAQGRIKPDVDDAVSFFARWTRADDTEIGTVDYRPAALAELPDELLRKRIRELRQIHIMSPLYVVMRIKKFSQGEAMRFLAEI
jgi:hypothetical protein